MAAECPVIGSNVGGIPDIITDGKNGFLVPEQDLEILADKINLLLSDEELREKFRKNGLLKVQESFTWDTISSRFSDIYSEIVSEIETGM
jgi:glycosyltransferase involved in cell wall biosynthesis